MARQRSDLSTPDIEAIWLELTLPNRKKTLICSLYNPPNADFDAFKASLDNILDQSASEGIETLLLGDFNCDMLPKRLPRISKELMQLLNLYQFDQLIKEPTHKCSSLVQNPIPPIIAQSQFCQFLQRF